MAKRRSDRCGQPAAAIHTTGLLTAKREPRGGVFCMNVHKDHWDKRLLSPMRGITDICALWPEEQRGYCQGVKSPPRVVPMASVRYRTCDRAAGSGPAAVRAPEPSWQGPRPLLSGTPEEVRLEPARTSSPMTQEGLFRQPCRSVTGCSNNEEYCRLMELQPHRSRVARQGAQLLLREMPGVASPAQGFQRPTGGRVARSHLQETPSCFLSPSPKALSRALCCAPQDGRFARPWPTPVGFRQPRPASSPW